VVFFDVDIELEDDFEPDDVLELEEDLLVVPPFEEEPVFEVEVEPRVMWFGRLPNGLSKESVMRGLYPEREVLPEIEFL
jgi:hypothetical protein